MYSKQCGANFTVISLYLGKTVFESNVSQKTMNCRSGTVQDKCAVESVHFLPHFKNPLARSVSSTYNKDIN